MLLALFPLLATAQGIDLGAAREAAHKGHVTLLSDTLPLIAEKTQTVELRFRVDPGFHINSHAPADELLIPTELKLDASNGVTVLDEQYPRGSAFRLAVGAGETLDVYQGEFRVTVKLAAAKGASLLTGSLRYQACDNAACFPPRTLPIKIALTGR